MENSISAVVIAVFFLIVLIIAYKQEKSCKGCKDKIILLAEENRLLKLEKQHGAGNI